MADAADIERNLERLDPDLRFVLAEKSISRELQAKFAENGITALAIFAMISDTRADLRSMLCREYSLDPATEGLPAGEATRRRVSAAQVVDAWEASKIRVDEANRRNAEQRAGRLPMTILRSTHVAMRLAFEKTYGARADKEFPAESYIEQRFEEVDQGDLKAESLKEAISRDEVSEDPTSAVMDTDGTVRIKRGKSEVRMPSNSEELRRRIRVLGVTFVLAKLRHSNRAYLADASLEMWNDHCDYVLGDTVMNMKTSSADGKLIHRPDWKQVLIYEFEIRKQMTRLVLYEGMTIATALKAARKDTEIKETFFVTPNAMAAATDRERSPRGNRRGDYSYYGNKGNGKGKGKQGKGKGKSKFIDSLHHQTPDGRKICYAFNSVYERCKGNCGMVHVCRKCFGNHPAHACKRAASTGLKTEGEGTAPATQAPATR